MTRSETMAKTQQRGPGTVTVPLPASRAAAEGVPSAAAEPKAPAVSTPPAAARPQLTLKRNSPESQLPYWKRKEDLRKKMREERWITTSVRRESIAKDKIRFTILGAGLVARPKDLCFKLSQQYPKLREVSDHFRTVSFDPRTSQLFLITEALGYQARMILQMTPVSEDWRSELQWEVVWGHFKGMKGVMGFEDAGGSRTEISINARYEAEELPLPKALMGFALEVITQKVAEKMRAYLEAQSGIEVGSSSAEAPSLMLGAPGS